MDRSTLKGLAKEQIRGTLGTWFLIALIIGAIVGVAQLIPLNLGTLASAIFLSPPFALAIVFMNLRLTEGIKPTVSGLFSQFENFWAAFKVQFLVGLFTLLWSLLLYIPGIIKGLSYSQAIYILAENPNMPAREAIRRSQDMMDGHKMELFILNLSFIGWMLLSVLTFGILYIWLIPYMNATMANFHKKLLEEYSTRNTVL